MSTLIYAAVHDSSHLTGKQFYIDVESRNEDDFLTSTKTESNYVQIITNLHLQNIQLAQGKYSRSQKKQKETRQKAHASPKFFVTGELICIEKKQEEKQVHNLLVLKPLSKGHSKGVCELREVNQIV